MNAVTSIEQSQKIHARDVRIRLMGKEKKEETSNELERLLQQRVRSVSDENAFLKRRVKELEYLASDYQSRILDQASQICAMQGIENTKIVRKAAVGDIVKKVLKDFPGVYWEDIISVRRTRALITPRHLCMAAVHEQRPDLSLPAIGRIFGGRDHTTVLHAVRKISALQPKEGE